MSSSSPPTDATPCEICGDDPRWVTPYCQHVPPVVGGITAVQPREQRTKAEVLAEYDERMAAALAGVAPVNPTGTPGAPQGGTSPQFPAVRKRKRRTAEEMKIVRAEAKARIEAARERVTPDWLVGADQDAEDFAASLRESE